MKRREFIAGLGIVAAWPLAARAQQPDRMQRVGVLMGVALDDPEGQARAEAFRKGLEGLGWIEGRNIQIDYRWSAGEADRARALSEELVQLSPNVILATASPLLVALKQETRTIPIVFLQVSDPVGQGFVESLSNPGGNVTGFTNFEFSMMGKWLELLIPMTDRFESNPTPANGNWIAATASPRVQSDLEAVLKGSHLTFGASP